MISHGGRDYKYPSTDTNIVPVKGGIDVDVKRADGEYITIEFTQESALRFAAHLLWRAGAKQISVKAVANNGPMSISFNCGKHPFQEIFDGRKIADAARPPVPAPKRVTLEEFIGKNYGRVLARATKLFQTEPWPAWVAGRGRDDVKQLFVIVAANELYAEDTAELFVHMDAEAYARGTEASE